MKWKWARAFIWLTIWWSTSCENTLNLADRRRKDIRLACPITLMIIISPNLLRKSTSIKEINKNFNSLPLSTQLLGRISPHAKACIWYENTYFFLSFRFRLFVVFFVVRILNRRFSERMYSSDEFAPSSMNCLIFIHSLYNVPTWIQRLCFH